MWFTSHSSPPVLWPVTRTSTSAPSTRSDQSSTCTALLGTDSSYRPSSGFASARRPGPWRRAGVGRRTAAARRSPAGGRRTRRRRRRAGVRSPGRSATNRARRAALRPAAGRADRPSGPLHRGRSSSSMSAVSFSRTLGFEGLAVDWAIAAANAEMISGEACLDSAGCRRWIFSAARRGDWKTARQKRAQRNGGRRYRFVGFQILDLRLEILNHRFQVLDFRLLVGCVRSRSRRKWNSRAVYWAPKCPALDLFWDFRPWVSSLVWNSSCRHPRRRGSNRAAAALVGHRIALRADQDPPTPRLLVRIGRLVHALGSLVGRRGGGEGFGSRMRLRGRRSDCWGR